MSYAALQNADKVGEMPRDGMVVNDRFISYFQVESVLYNYSKILEAGVIVKDHHTGHEELMVYLALEESFASIEERERYCAMVEDYIRRKFSVQIPINIQIKDKLPMTKSGKLLRTVLHSY